MFNVLFNLNYLLNIQYTIIYDPKKFFQLLMSVYYTCVALCTRGVCTPAHVGYACSTIFLYGLEFLDIQ